METSRDYKRVRFLLLYITIAAILFTDCEARRSLKPFRRPRHPRSSVIQTTKKLRVTKHLNMNPLLESVGYSVSSPFSLPPFESLGPMPLPENTPPYCLYPPNTPGTPSTTIPTPAGYTPSSPPSAPYYYLPPVLPSQSPPPSPEGTIPGTPEFTPTPCPPEILPSPPSIVPGSPEVVPSPPIYVPFPPGSTLSPPYYEPSPPSYVPSPPSYVPSPTGFVPSPPSYFPSPTGFVPSPPSYVPSPPSYVPSPTGFVPSPPSYFPSPTGFVPSPPVFEPPVVFPPPTVPPPPPNTASSRALWCVAKPSVPDPIIQEAMDYACWSGADCDSIQPQGSCSQPNTLFAHASYAFNSYWQRTKVAGGTCEFGGTAMLVTVDPSYDGCHFLYF